jgi:hypothetical protein
MCNDINARNSVKVEERGNVLLNRHGHAKQVDKLKEYLSCSMMNEKNVDDVSMTIKTIRPAASHVHDVAPAVPVAVCHLSSTHNAASTHDSCPTPFFSNAFAGAGGTLGQRTRDPMLQLSSLVIRAHSSSTRPPS